MTHVDVAGAARRFRVNTQLTREQVLAFKAYARTVPMSEIKALMRLVIDPGDFQRYWRLSVEHRRSTAQHVRVAQTILTGLGFDDLLDERSSWRQ